MKKVDKYISERIKKDAAFKAKYDLIKQKAKVVKKIIEYRNKHNLSQSGFAKQIGVTQQYISKIEEGEFSSLETVEIILHQIGYRIEINVVKLKKAS